MRSGRLADEGRAQGERTRQQASHRGTPPEDVSAITAGLLARGSWRLCRAFPMQRISGQYGSRSPLTVAGAAPALPYGAPGSLLAPRTQYLEPRRP